MGRAKSEHTRIAYAKLIAEVFRREATHLELSVLSALDDCVNEAVSG